jgi:hypothetical protein
LPASSSADVQLEDERAVVLLERLHADLVRTVGRE